MLLVLNECTVTLVKSTNSRPNTD